MTEIMTLDDALAQSIAHHNAGRLVEAEQLYRAILLAQPQHADANHNIGVLAVQVGKPEAGLAYFKAALDADPSQSQFWVSYIDALLQAGQYSEARLTLSQGRQGGLAKAEAEALAARVDLAGQMIFDEAVAHHQAGRLDTAVADYLRALTVKPDYADAHNNLGNALRSLDRLDEAEVQFCCALEIKPDYFEAHNNLANTLRDLGRLDEAETAYRNALEVMPDFAEAHINLGALLHLKAAELSGKKLSLNEEYISGVRGQYEALPFPARDPHGERHVLQISAPDILSKVNQYCFGGTRDFSKGIRVLVAGAGTGDSALWLAHQLRGTPSEIVALDISTASLDIARARAELRGINTIQWVNASLLDLPKLGLGYFDYISCLGVLHHLPDPDAGLAALEAVLAEDGGLAVMLYGALGRSHIYPMQDLLRKLTTGLNLAQRLNFTRQIISTLPETNEFRHRVGDKCIRDSLIDSTDLFDLLLHEQDRAYTASEVRSFFAEKGLYVQSFTTFRGEGEVFSSLQYDLDLYIHDNENRHRLAALPDAMREDLAEALDGSLALHTVYATRTPQSALDPMAPHAILSPLSQHASSIIEHLIANESGVSVILSNKYVIKYMPKPITLSFLSLIDGVRSNREIAKLINKKSSSAVLEQVGPDLKVPTALHWLVARTSNGSRWPRLTSYGGLSLPLHYSEPSCLAEAGWQAFPLHT
ncbi:hypothetical protein MCP1_20147 [Candidatus Terasakiella magnetica]|nr:hypothetical protein MCP1_20147 [Candidatus Terasakiella magnetica]